MRVRVRARARAYEMHHLIEYHKYTIRRCALETAVADKRHKQIYLAELYISFVDRPPTTFLSETFSVSNVIKFLYEIKVCIIHKQQSMYCSP